MRCNIYNALTFKSYSNELGDDIQLPNNTEQVEVISFRANKFAQSNLKSVYSSKLKQCNDTDSLIKMLVQAPKTKSKSSNVNKPTPYNVKSQDTTECDSLQGIDLNNSSYTDYKECGSMYAKQGYVISAVTQEILGECRTHKSLREAWLRQSYYIYNCAYWGTSVFTTVKLDTAPTFSELNKIVALYAKQVKRKFDNFVCGFIFLEPHYNGSWHVHFIIGFDKYIPKKYEAETKKWWEKYNNELNQNQVKIMDFDCLQSLINRVNYLNPANVDKKQKRIKYYPKSAQPIRRFGTVSEANRALTSYEIAKKVVGDDAPTSRTKLEVFDTQTGELLYHRSSYHHYSINFSFDDVSYRNDTKVNEKIKEEQQPKEYEQLTFFPIFEPVEHFSEDWFSRKCDYENAIATGNNFRLSTLFT